MRDRPIWDDGAWLGFPRLATPTTADLCVIGLGGSGLRAVAEGMNRGLRVVGLDAGEVAGGAAGRNGGFLLAGMARFYHDARTAYGPDRARSFYQQTLDELEHIYGEGHSRQTGSLRIGIDAAEMADVEMEFDALREDGFAAEWYEGPEGSGLLVPENGVCNPMRRVRELACSLADDGASLFEHSAAVDIEQGRVDTGLGVVEADHVIVAVDGGLEVLFPELAGRVRTASLQMLATEPDHEASFSRPVYTNFGHEYYQQLPDGSVALGGGRDRHPDLSWTVEPGLIGDIQSDLDDVLARIGVSAPVARRWHGLAAWTGDDRPVMEEVRPGVVAIGAYSGHGNVVGSVYARLAVDAVVSGTPLDPPL